MTNFLLLLAMLIAFLFLLYLGSAGRKPVFRMRCEICGKKDRNWETVCVGHDDFAWAHKCEKKS